MPKSPRHAPSELTDCWPDVTSPDTAGESARQLANNLRHVIDEERKVSNASVRSIADDAGIDEGTIRNILSGARWPDLRTITLLEEALNTSLWPARSDEGLTSEA